MNGGGIGNDRTAIGVAEDTCPRGILFPKYTKMFRIESESDTASRLLADALELNAVADRLTDTASDAVQEWELTDNEQKTFAKVLSEAVNEINEAIAQVLGTVTMRTATPCQPDQPNQSDRPDQPMEGAQA